MVVRSSKDVAMTLPVTVDPRYHDAVIFNLDNVLTDTDGVQLFESTINLVRKLLDVGIATAVHSLLPGGQQLLKAAGIDKLFGICLDGLPAAVLVEAARRLGVSAQRAVVVEDTTVGVRAGRDGGFAPIGVARRPGPGRRIAARWRRRRAGRAGRPGGPYRRQTHLRTAECAGVLRPVGRGHQRPGTAMVFLDFDGTLSPIVSDPGAAALVVGAAQALELVAAVCPVAILSGRDLADIRDRVGVPGIWYAGSHGFELTAPDGTYHCNAAAAVAVGVLARAAASIWQRPPWPMSPEFGWSTSGSPSRCTTARSHRTTSARSWRRHTGWAGEPAYG